MWNIKTGRVFSGSFFITMSASRWADNCFFIGRFWITCARFRMMLCCCCFVVVLFFSLVQWMRKHKKRHRHCRPQFAVIVIIVGTATSRRLHSYIASWMEPFFYGVSLNSLFAIFYIYSILLSNPFFQVHLKCLEYLILNQILLTF